jgi:hypothetical protein
MDIAGDPAALRRLAGWAFVSGLCLAALVAVAALLSGSFDQTDLRVIGTSLGFSVFSATGAAGGRLRNQAETWRWAIGTVAFGTSLLAFALLIAAIWLQTENWSGESADRWRAFGVCGLLALWASHASLVVGALRARDTGVIRPLAAIGVGALAIDTSFAILAVLGQFDDADLESGGRALAALLVVALLCSVLPPLIRRLQRAPVAPVPGNELADGVAAVADRLGAMELPPQARAEVARLRELVAVSRRSRT